MRTPRWQLPLIAAVTGLLPGPGAGQSIDIRAAHLRMNRAIDLQLRVRAEGAQDAPIPPHCLRAEVVADGQLLDADELRIVTRGDPHPGWTRVHIRHRHRLRDAQAQVRLSLQCGPSFERHFTVLASEGAATAAPPRARHADSPGVEAARRSATPSASATPPVRSAQAVAPPSDPARSSGTTSAQTTGTLDPSTDSSLPGAPAGRRPDLPPMILPSTTKPSSVATAATATATATTNTGPVALHTADQSRLAKELGRLQAAHQKALADMGVLRARLTHEERSPSKATWIGLSGLLALLMVSLGHLALDRPIPRWRFPWPRAPKAPQAALDIRAPQPDGSETPRPSALRESGRLPTSRTSPSPVRPLPVAQGITTGTEAGTGDRWRNADFGRPCLDPDDIDPVLEEVERLTLQGYPAAATLTLEHALMKQDGKHPALLLALLDLYDEMGQPWNQERVAAQLEALYNVRLAPATMATDDAPSPEDSPLMACPRSLERITRAWTGREAATAVASLLVRPAAVEILPLPAFRDAVWLHRLASARLGLPAMDVVELSLTPLAND